MAILFLFPVVALVTRETEPIYQERPVSAWMDDLLSRSPAARFKAAEAIRSIGPAAVPIVTNILAADTKFYKERIKKVARLPRPFRGNRLVKDWLGPSSRSQMVALLAIEHLGASASEAAPFVVQLCPQYPAQARDALLSIGPAGMRALIEGLASPTWPVRLGSIETLGVMGDGIATGMPTVMETMSSGGSFELDAAMKSVESIRLATVTAITNVLLSAPDAATRVGGLRLLERFGSKTEAGTNVLAGLMAAPDPLVRAQAVYCLARINAPESFYVPLIVPLLKDEDAEVRLAAAHNIARFEDALRENWEAMEALRNDPNEEIRRLVKRELALKIRLKP